MLHFDLKVNGETIGKFEARNLWPTAGEERGICDYSCHLTEWPKPGVTVSGHALIQHRRDDGAWALVRKALEQMGGPR